MPILHIVVLALVQGVTEFLPVSSSGHLILAPILLGWKDQGLTMDVAVHAGTLGAVLIYFHRDIRGMLLGLTRLPKGGADEGARRAGLLIVATLPVVGAGYAVNALMGDSLRNLSVIGWATLGFGVLLHICDRVGATARRIEHLQWSDALVIGLAQCLALIPGASRSGTTISAGRIIGMERGDCARFSMLMSIPAILGAGVLKGKELYESGDAALTQAALTGAGIAFVSALVAIWIFMLWLKRFGMTPFVVYRIALGTFLLALAHGFV